jgi:hypothetical protein
MRISCRAFVWVFVIPLGLLPACPLAQSPVARDTDRDGLSDELEQRLLMHFEPAFMIGAHDCSDVPAEFEPGMETPTLKAADGTVYGQVKPYGKQMKPYGGQVTRAKGSTEARPLVEIHYYHLWWKDCGPHGHPLDAEHVAVLVEGTGDDVATADWKAMYWYAAAHEDTVCDVSQIARASTLHAEDRGAKVWVSLGKHASYLSERMCTGGCGADKCEDMHALKTDRVINFGEPGHPMNGSAFVASTEWPLAGKMAATNFPAEPLARLNGLPETDIAWFRAGRHPERQVIAVSGETAGAIARSGDHMEGAISVAGDSTANALATAEDSTGNALEKSYKKTAHALGSAARHLGAALGVAEKRGASEPGKE